MLENISPVSPVFALAIVPIALLAAACLKGFEPPATSSPGRFATLDGLRGFLVLGVFTHHSAITYFYLRSGVWDLPPSKLYTHLGQSGVALFFMITSFLFWTKLLNQHRKPIYWVQLYTSRLLRLAPLYLFSVLLIFAIVTVLTGAKLQDSVGQLAIDTFRWLALGVLGAPDLNGLPKTWIIDAGVTWSLRYEWLFYAALPLGALFLRFRLLLQVVTCLVVATAAALVAPRFNPARLMLIFGGGIAAALWVRHDKLRSLCLGRGPSTIALACFGVVVVFFSSGHDFGAMLLLTIAFTIIASGNSLFGLLTLQQSRLIGDMGYSVYLLHGILLFVVFQALRRTGVDTGGSAAAHWLIVFLITAPLVWLCYLTYRMIELPCMKLTPRAVAWMSEQHSRNRPKRAPANPVHCAKDAG